MPFAGYTNFAACTRANADKADPNAYCATIMRSVEGGAKAGHVEKAASPTIEGAWAWCETMLAKGAVLVGGPAYEASPLRLSAFEDGETEVREAGAEEPLEDAPRAASALAKGLPDYTVLEAVPVEDALVVTDVLCAAGADLAGRPQGERRSALLKMLVDCDPGAGVVVAKQRPVRTRAELAMVLKWACQQPASEGLLLQATNATYEAGEAAGRYLLKASWEESKHPRAPKGRANGGQFASAGGGGPEAGLSDSQIAAQRQRFGGGGPARTRSFTPGHGALTTISVNAPDRDFEGMEEDLARASADADTGGKATSPQDVSALMSMQRIAQHAGRLRTPSPRMDGAVIRQRLERIWQDRKVRPALRDLAYQWGKMFKADGDELVLLKADAPLKQVTGVVFEPEVEDTQGDVIDAGEIAKACHQFLKDYRAGRTRLRLSHAQDLDDEDAVLVENWVAPEDFTVGEQPVRKGTWLQTWQVLRDDLWGAIAEGKLTGFSFGGVGVRALAKAWDEGRHPRAPKGSEKGGEFTSGGGGGGEASLSPGEARALERGRQAMFDQGLNINTLVDRGSDRLDFHDVHALTARAGLAEAYRAGSKAEEVPEAALEAIAQRELGYSLVPQHSNRLDFHDTGVASLRRAFRAAYAAGRSQARGGATAAAAFQPVRRPRR